MASFTSALQDNSGYKARTNALGDVNQRVKADYKPEIFFIGQIVGGTDFPTQSDGIFVEATLVFGEDWKIIEKTAHSI